MIFQKILHTIMAKVITNLNKAVLTIHFNVYKNSMSFTQILLLRNLATNSIKREDAKDLTYVKNDLLYRSSKVGTLGTLQKLLQINKVSAMQIVADYKHLCKAPPKLMIDNYEICKMYDLSNETIINCPYILGQKDLPEKIHILKELPQDINKMVGLLKMDMGELLKIVQQFKKEQNRVIYFSELLNVSPLEICEQIRKKPFLMKLNLEKATELVQLLTEYGITNREIFNDLWSLNYKKSTMEKRIQFAKENNLEKVKTWMIRAPSEILLNYIKIRSDNKLILGNNSLAEYLSNRLECPIEQANYIITRLPALKTKSVKKMDEIIDYLYGQGFKPIQICITPKILLFSVEMMKKRISELQQQGVYVDNLNLLTKTQKQYQIFYLKLVKNNKKKLRGVT